MKKEHIIKSEDTPVYRTPVISFVDYGDRLIAEALEILASRMRTKGNTFSAPEDAKQHLRLKISELEHEVFGCLWLDAKHALIKDELLFRGTIDAAAIYPREVAKAALQCNAAAVIFYHNHPSGNSDPSQADKNITDKLKQALALFEVKALDHFIVVCDDVYSFAEHGLI